MPNTSLHDAARANDTNTIFQLSVQQTALDTQDEHGSTALHVAIENSQTAAVRALLALSPCLISIKNGAGLTPIQLAVSQNNNNITEILITAGGKIHAPYSDEDTLLHKAVQLNNHLLIRLLILHGAEPTAKNKLKQTVYDIADETTKIFIRKCFNEKNNHSLNQPNYGINLNSSSQENIKNLQQLLNSLQQIDQTGGTANQKQEETKKDIDSLKDNFVKHISNNRSDLYSLEMLVAKIKMLENTYQEILIQQQQKIDELIHKTNEVTRKLAQLNNQMQTTIQCENLFTRSTSQQKDFISLILEMQNKHHTAINQINDQITSILINQTSPYKHQSDMGDIAEKQNNTATKNAAKDSNLYESIEEERADANVSDEDDSLLAVSRSFKK